MLTQTIRPPQIKQSTVEQLKQEIRYIKTSIYRFSPWMLRKDGLNIQCSRDKLINALKNHQQRMSCLIRIQTCWRRHLARSFYSLKKPRNDCANDSDFCTMDPIQEIPIEELFCFKSTPISPYYGFNIISLLNYFYKSRSTILLNPYNREIISLKIVSKWIYFIKKFEPLLYNKIISESYYKYFLNKKNGRNHHQPITQPPVELPPLLPIAAAPTNQIVANLITNDNNPDYPIQYNQVIVFEEDHITLQHHLMEIQRLQINMRIQELFIDFDLCGNYTSAVWFLQLTLRFLKSFYMKLKELWRNLPSVIQQSICTIGDPFYLVNVQNLNVSFQEMKLACVRIMEYITYGTHNKEDQKLGVFQILIALASVSYPAHDSLTHLINM